MYNLRNIYQTKNSNLGQRVWKAIKSESSRRVIVVHLHITVTAENFDRHVTDTVPKLLLTRTLSFPLLRLPWHQFELDAWSWLLASLRVRNRKYLAVSFIFRILDTGKDSSRLRFSSKYSTPWWIFHKDRIVGVSWRWYSLVLVGQKKAQVKLGRPL